MATVYTSRVIQKLARKTGVSYDEARRLMHNYEDIIQDEVAKGNRVTLIGFGAFYADTWKGRRVFGTDCSDRQVARFVAGAEFKRVINK